MALNASKLWTEAKLYYKTWWNPSQATHAGGSYVNRWVEAARASPYWAGHADALLVPTLVLQIVGLVVALYHALHRVIDLFRKKPDPQP